MTQDQTAANTVALHIPKPLSCIYLTCELAREIMFSVANKLPRRMLLTRRFLSTTSRDPALFMWGTNTNGTLLGTEDKLWDVPTEVEWRDVLGGESDVT